VKNQPQFYQMRLECEISTLDLSIAYRIEQHKQANTKLPISSSVL